MIDSIRTLWAYNFWAAERFFDAASALPGADFARDLGDGTGSVRDKLGHIYGADHVWLRRIQGAHSPGMPPVSDIASASALRSMHQAVLAEYANMIRGLDSGEPGAHNRLIRYRNLKGVEFETPLFEILLHAANHATYHRGQAASLIRRLTGSPPVTDLIEFFRSRGSSEAAARS